MIGSAIVRGNRDGELTLSDGERCLVVLKNIYIRCARTWIKLEESPVRHERFLRVTLFRGSIETRWKGVRAHSYFEFRSFGCCIAVSIHPHCALTPPWQDTQSVQSSLHEANFFRFKRNAVSYMFFDIFINELMTFS